MALYQIKEFGKIRSAADFPDHRQSDSEITIPARSFNNVWDFILENQYKEKSIEPAFRLYSKHGKRVIQAQNYVGIIETSQKDSIEILPKIYDSDSTILGLKESKRIFLKMLASLKNTPFIALRDASIHAKRDFPVLELFISLYIGELEQLILSGLKKDYTKYEENSNFLKGSLLFHKHILKNIVDKSVFYIRSSRYLHDIPQNRIILSTVRKLIRITSSFENKERLRKLDNMLGDLKESIDIEADIEYCKRNNRLFDDYEKLLNWSEVFLLNKGFTNFYGRDINQALLFPMESVFESFIGYLFRKFNCAHEIKLNTFHFHLVSSHINSGKFRLLPDIFAKPLDQDKPPSVIDTKWKIVDETLPDKNYLISQSDMYQLYAYGRKYIKEEKEPKLYLIYPQSPSFTEKLQPFFYEEHQRRYHLELRAIPFDLSGNYENQISAILNGPEGHQVR